MQPQSNGAGRTLWMGDLEPWMDAPYLMETWNLLKQTTKIKTIRDRSTGGPAGYCFVEFESPEIASWCLSTFNNTPIPNSHKTFKLNWASGGTLSANKAPEYSIFVGDLASEIDDASLLQAFQNRYASVRSAKVVTDPNTCASKGYGFVRFASEDDKIRALAEMGGHYIGSRPIRVSPATPRMAKHQHPMHAIPPHHHQPGMLVHYPLHYHYHQLGSNPANTTVFVGGLPPTITEDELVGYFASFGEIAYTRIPIGKGCGFVQFAHRSSAEMAIQQMNGCVVADGSRLRLSWGRAPPMHTHHMAHHYNGIHAYMPDSSYSTQMHPGVVEFPPHVQQSGDALAVHPGKADELVSENRSGGEPGGEQKDTEIVVDKIGKAIMDSNKDKEIADSNKDKDIADSNKDKHAGTTPTPTSVPETQTKATNPSNAPEASTRYKNTPLHPTTSKHDTETPPIASSTPNGQNLAEAISRMDVHGKGSLDADCAAVAAEHGEACRVSTY